MELTDEQILDIARDYSLGGPGWKAGWSFLFSDPSELLDFARNLISAHRPGPTPATSPTELLCELLAFAVMCDDKLKGDGLWDEEEDYSDGLLDRVRAEIERQQSAPAAPPRSSHTPPSPAAAPSPAGSTDGAHSSQPEPPSRGPDSSWTPTTPCVQRIGGPELSDQEIAERAAVLRRLLEEHS